MRHETIEKSAGLLGVLTAIAISIGGLAESCPYHVARSGEPTPGVMPTRPCNRGTDTLREGCMAATRNDPPVPRRDRALWPLLAGR